jgi:hypothetical protein
MSSQKYAGQGTLPPELDQRVQSELGNGERLVWIGQPRPDLYRTQTACITIVGGIFGGTALVMFLVGAGMAFGFVAGGAGKGAAAAFDCFPLVFCLFTIPVMIIGGIMAAAPIWMPQRIRRIIYALTDRRAVIWEPYLFGGRYTVRNYTREGLGRMYRVDTVGGAGDLVFEEYYTISANSDGTPSKQRNQRGFLAIDQVRDVEELVRLTLMP